LKEELEVHALALARQSDARRIPYISVLNVLGEERDDQRTKCRSDDRAKEKEPHPLAGDRLPLHCVISLLNLEQRGGFVPAFLEIVVVPLLSCEDMDDNLAVV
jgi:hypothetical protein